MEMRTTLRMIVREDDIRKMTLFGRHLTHLLHLILQDEDPDFNNALVNLTNVTDLPDKPALKMIALVLTRTPSTDDTEILSESQSSLTRSPWPDTFETPCFPVDTEYRLRQGSPVYTRDKTYLQVPRDMKQEMPRQFTASRRSPVMKNSMKLQLHWFKNIHASLDQAPSTDVTAGKTALSSKRETVAPNCIEVDVQMWP